MRTLCKGSMVAEATALRLWGMRACLGRLFADIIERYCYGIKSPPGRIVLRRRGMMPLERSAAGG